MKTKFIRLLGALLFSLLFYRQDFGLNMVLFAAITILVLAFTRKTLFTRKEFGIATLLYLVSALFVFTVNSLLSIASCLIAFIIFIGTISGQRNAVYVQWVNGIYQLFLGAVHFRLNTKNAEIKTKQKTNYGFILLTIVVVTAILFLFGSLYAQANPILGHWMSQVNLDFINIGWVINTLMGYALLLNITSPAELDVITTVDREASNLLNLSEIPNKRKVSLKKQVILGTTMLSSLLLLILLFITTDIAYILSNPLSNAVTLSKTVHEGVNALIISIVCAITLILILFRGDLNFYKKSAHLRTLTLLWILCNIIIIALTAYKNFLYSSDYGLTHKRIGVFIYLILCISGMATTYLKIAHKNNFLFMIRSNARVAYFVLIAMSSFHWGRTITAFNLAQVKHPDLTYLLTKIENNGDLLHAFAKAYPKKTRLQKEQIDNRYQERKYRLSQETWQSKTLYGLLHQQNTTYEISSTPEVSH